MESHKFDVGKFEQYTWDMDILCFFSKISLNDVRWHSDTHENKQKIECKWKWWWRVLSPVACRQGEWVEPSSPQVTLSRLNCVLFISGNKPKLPVRVFHMMTDLVCHESWLLIFTNVEESHHNQTDQFLLTIKTYFYSEEILLWKTFQQFFYGKINVTFISITESML